MNNEIDVDALISRVQSSGVNLIIVGALVDLTMHNGWVKKNEFVSIDYQDSLEFMQHLVKSDFREFNFKSKLIDANNQVIGIDIYALVDYAPSLRRGNLALFDHLQIGAATNSKNMECSNVRLVTHASVGRQVFGNDYANGDFLKKNVPNDGRNQYC